MVVPRLCAVVMLAGLVSGCAIPPAITLAKLAGDGMLMMATGKSSTDHGVSLATGRDCATTYLFDGENYCRDGVAAAEPVQVAAAEVDYVAAYAVDTPPPPVASNAAAVPELRVVAAHRTATVASAAKRPAKVASAAHKRTAWTKAKKRLAAYHPPRSKARLSHSKVAQSAALHKTVPPRLPPALLPPPSRPAAAAHQPAERTRLAWTVP
jgi:hypothetical protein